MQGIKFLIAITKRDYAENYLDFFRSKGLNNVVSTLCNGTAKQTTLSLMGIENTEKIMFNSMIREEDIPDFIKEVKRETDILETNSGFIAFMPLDCIGGSSSLKYFAGEKPLEKKEGENMNSEIKTVMIVVVVNKGNTELVMDAARNAGANGGTVVRAKGTGAELAKFFGASISEEKEMVYILSKKENRDDIMKAIMEKAGSKTEAHGVLFSMPVDKVVGLSSFED